MAMNIRTWFCSILLLLTFSSKAEDPSASPKYRVEAFGRGQTTGHVADLLVRNKNKTDLKILPQRVFIPSGGPYQPYIVDIPAATIKPDSTRTLRLIGYCTDEHLRPSPADLELVSIDRWVPIRSLDTTAKEGLLLVSKNSVVPFIKDHISYIITSLAYKPLYPAPDTSFIALWPGTDIPVGGTLSHYERPDLFATVISKTLSLLETGVDSIQATKDYSTPFSVNVKKERETLIQQLLWMYATALAGKKYEKDTFASKLYDQFKIRSGLDMIPALEKEELDEGVDEFWNLFLRIARETKLFDVKKPLTVHGTLVDLPVDTIRYPWSIISLTDIIMKPAYAKIVPVKGSSPVIPILAGSTSAGTLLYIAFHKQEPDSTCIINASLQSFPSGCQQDNGSVVLTIDADSLYSYSWSNGSTGRDLISVPAGQYTVTVTRKGTTCTQIFQSEITNTDPVITTEIITHDAHCGGSDGSAVPSVNPPGFYTYSWSDGSTDQILDSVPGGLYTLIVQAGGTCTDTTEVFINDLPVSYSVSISTNPELCGGNDGRAEASVTPEGVYSFLWSNGDTTSAINSLAAGSYFLTVTQPGTTCQIISEAVVGSIDGPVVTNVTVTHASCGLQDGAIDVAVNPPGEYDFIWSNGDSTNSIQNLASGTYTLIVSLPGTDCSDTVSITVFELPPPISLSTTVLQHAYCGLSNGSAIAVPSVAGEYTYQWPNGQATQQATNLAAGTYSVSVTIAGTQCVLTQSVTIDSVAPQFINVISISPANCISNGEVSFQIIAADTSLMTMEIVHPGGTIVINPDTGVHNLSTYINVIPGLYVLTVYDPVIGPSCSDKDSVTIELINPAISANFDQFSTLPDQPVSGNVLSNDLGLNLVMISIDSTVGGAVSFTPDGNFTFTPGAGFSGEGRFIYIIQDACGISDTAFVIIVVQPGVPKTAIDDTGFSFEPTVSNMEMYIPEQSSFSSIFLSGMAATMNYNTGRLSQQSRILILSNSLRNSAFTLYQFEQRIEVCKLDLECSSIMLQGSIGARTTTSYDFLNPVFAGAHATFQFDIKRKFRFKTELSLRGLAWIESPQLLFAFSIPCLDH